MNKYVVGIIFSCVFIYFSVRGLEFDKIVEALQDVKYSYLIMAALLMLLTSVLRSLRWGMILSPIEKIGQKSLFSIFSVGFMAVVLIPMRVGELVRAYLLRTNSHVSFTTALSTIFVERVFDMLTILLILFVVILQAPVPLWLLKAGYTALVLSILMILFMCFCYFKTGETLRLIRPVLGWLPHRFQGKLEGLIKNFITGFEIIRNPGKILGIAILSTLIWVISGLAIYSLFWFQGLELNLVVAFVVLVVNIVGVSLPTAPGMLGNFQLSCIVALSLFNVNKDVAFVFSMVYYLLGIGIIVFLGLVFLPFIKFSLRNVLRDMRRKLTTEEGEIPNEQ
jgi:glycosyltransferase 2 family protein